MKRNGVFLFTALIALFFWQWVFFSFDRHFNGMKEARTEITHLKKSIERANVRTEVVQWRFDLFKQEVAKSAPSLMKMTPPESQQAVRGLASVVQAAPEEFLMLAQFEASIDDLRTLFEKQRFKEVIRKSKNILELNPVSSSLVVVYFMLAESYYQEHALEECFAIAQQMIQLFPEEEKTGYVLLRVGMFLKEKNRLEEAKNMFSLVAHAFEQNKELKNRSEKFLAALGGVE
ncbi:MAG: hypothetical protein RJB66_1638 [Pseudomonadota bacterium]|jgi:tetratricopeptide (TPR) repeat protein